MILALKKLKRLASGLGRTAALKKRVKISSWGSPRRRTFTERPCVKRPPVIIYMKEKKANSNRVKTYYSESYLKGQSHFFQLKKIA